MKSLIEKLGEESKQNQRNFRLKLRLYFSPFIGFKKIHFCKTYFKVKIITVVTPPRPSTWTEIVFFILLDFPFKNVFHKRKLNYHLQNNSLH